MRSHHVVLLLLTAALIGCAEPRTSETVTVFAAASLTDAMEVLADSFETAHPGTRVVLNVAGTSVMARQIEQGAAADVFFSANLAWMAHLEAQDLIAGPVRYPLANRLVVVGPEDAIPLDSLGALAEVQRLALADPDHVPAGIYARQGLECAALWDKVQPRVVPTLDVRAALLAVRNGAAEVAVVYTSDAIVEPNVQVLLDWPADCAPEIRYAAARLQDAPNPEGAQQFLEFITDPRREAVWERFGFISKPGGQ